MTMDVWSNEAGMRVCAALWAGCLYVQWHVCFNVAFLYVTDGFGGLNQDKYDSMRGCH